MFWKVVTPPLCGSTTFGDVVFQFTGSTASLPIVDKFDLNLDAAVPESVYRVTKF